LENVIDRFLILQNSQIIFDGMLADLRAKEANVELSFNSQLMPNLIQNLNGVTEVKHSGDHFIVLTKTLNSTLQDLTSLLTGIKNLKIKQNSLENIFMDLNQEKK